MPEPTLAQMRAWLEKQKLSCNAEYLALNFENPARESEHRTAHNAMLDAILAALGETGDR